MMSIMSVFFMSTQPLVIAPRPNVGPKLETVGPCQTLAWFSKCTTPRARSDFVYRIVPRNILPFGTTRSAHQGLKQAPIVHDLLLQRGTLRAQRAAVGRMIGVALNVNHLRGHILRAVANRVDNGAAANRT